MIFFSPLCSRPRSRSSSLLCAKKGKGSGTRMLCASSPSRDRLSFTVLLFTYLMMTSFCVLLSACISNPLGMKDGSITDSMITASSTHAHDKASWGRLYCSRGSWTPSVDSGYQWFQVNFVPEVKQITHIATQGDGMSWWWVMRYYVMYKAEGAALQQYKENDQRVVSEGITTVEPR